MSQNLTLPDTVFDKLAQGAAQRGMTMPQLLAFLLESVSLPERPTARDRRRSRRIEQLLDRYRTRPLSEQERETLGQLIDTDYQEALARSDRLIAAKKSRPSAGRNSSIAKQPVR
jgi:hypothetical protein